jgi:uncharacterized protein (TIGR02271 family)
MSRTVTALFDTWSEADQAKSRLQESRIDAERIRIIDQSAGGSSTAGMGNMQEERGERGFMASLKELFMPDEDRHAYGEGISRGGFLVCANVDEDEADEAIRILEESNSVDFDQRQEEWRSSGWAGYTGQESGYHSGGGTGSTISGSETSGSGIPTTAMGSNAFSGTAATETAGHSADATRDQMRTNTVEEERIPIVEEQLNIGKREVNRGGARVRSYIKETPVHEQVNLREEHVSVERRPVDRTLAGGDLGQDSDLLRDRTIEMTETAEEAVIDKEARVREELVVRKTAEEHTETIDDTVRRTEVDVDEGLREGSDRPALFQNRSGDNREEPTSQSELGRTDYERTDRDRGI